MHEASRHEPHTTGSFLSFDGTPIGFQIIGAAQGKPVLLANGLGADHTYYRKLIAALGATHRFFTWDYRGTHSSGRPMGGYATLRLEDHARDGLALLEHHALERVPAIGWSMGVQVLLEMCRGRGDRFERLVLHNGVAGRPWETIGGDGDLARALARRLGGSMPRALRAVQRIDGFASRVLTGAVGHAALVPTAIRVGMAHKDIDRETFGALAQVFGRLDVHLYLEALVHMGQHDASDVLPHIACPTLVLAGTMDRLTPARAARAMAAAIPGAELQLLPGGSHYAALELPALVNERIARFLDGEGARDDAVPLRARAV
jgi:pimeloyl-ACP methyl ester carboxylesterase